MKTLPEDFRTYTQALMGEKLYQRLEHAILEEEAPTSIRINPFKCKDAVGEPILVSGNRPLSLYPSRIHLRSAAACRLILCTGSLIYVCRYGYPTVRKRTGDDAGSLCCPWRKVDCRKSSLAGRESALQQRTYAHPLTDSCRERTEVRSSGYDCYQQLSPRLQEIEVAV